MCRRIGDDYVGHLTAEDAADRKSWHDGVISASAGGRPVLSGYKSSAGAGAGTTTTLYSAGKAAY